jgi:putative ABC transport system permease protein
MCAAPRVAIINETMARRHWPDQDPIGQRFSIGAPDGGPMTVVGVVADVRQMGLDVPADPELFIPLDQTSIPFMWPRQMVVRTAGDPLALAPALRRAVWAVDPTQPVSSLRAMSEVLDTELANRDMQLTLTGTFALLALLLAAVGLYGVLSYAVSRSTNEIGLRMALGAQQNTVVGTVVRSALTTRRGHRCRAARGVRADAHDRFVPVRRELADPVTGAAVAGVLLLVAGLAAFVPALRAASVNPMTALRAEG